MVETSNTIDLLCCAVPVPISLISNIKKRWVFKEWGCTGSAFLVNLCGLVSISHLAALAYDRYEAMSLRRNSFLSKSRIIYVVIALWFYSFVFAIAPVIGWSSYTFEGVGTSCSVNWKSYDTNSVSYMVCIFLGCFVVPIAVILFSYYKVYISVKEMKNNANAIWGNMSAIAKATAKTERKMAALLWLMCFAFVLAWSPYAIVSLISAGGRSDWIDAITASIPAFLAKSSSLYNPIIYFLMYKRFRDKIFQLFGTHACLTTTAGSPGRSSSFQVRHQKKTNIKTLEEIQLACL